MNNVPINFADRIEVYKGVVPEMCIRDSLYDVADLKDYKRGEDYVNFRPDRVAMQDATAQMALDVYKRQDR